MEPVVMRTARLVLRPFRREDVSDVLAYANDETFARFVPTLPWPYAQEDAEEFVEEAVAHDWSFGPLFAVEHDGRVIGSSSLGVDTAELGYVIGPAWRGRGFATEVAGQMLAVGFDRCGLEVIWAQTDARNLASRRVLEKVGMRLDGVLRGRRVRWGERSDEHHYSILRDEWRKATGPTSRGAEGAGARRPDRSSEDRRLEWRGKFDNAEANRLHAEAFGHEVLDDDWRGQVERHSLGWVCARDDAGDLVGFVNVAWDGGAHAFILDAIVSRSAVRQGLGTAMVKLAAARAGDSGCQWLHVDFEEHLRPFYFDACGFRPTDAGLIRLGASSEGGDPGSDPRDDGGARTKTDATG
jgi:RimJ/RimL family protein N-acetyltransferase